MTNYRKSANEFAGPGHEDLVEAIAVYHHGNESMHMHQDIGKRVCSYCWLRAGRAVGVMVSRGALAVGVLSEVLAERARRDELSGQDWPDLNSAEDAVDRGLAAQMADMERIGAADPLCRSWSSLLMVEVWEAHSQKDPAALRAELVQAGAVITAWVEALDRRAAAAVSGSPSDLDVPPQPMRECCREATGSHYHCGNCGSDDVTGMFGHFRRGRFRCQERATDPAIETAAPGGGVPELLIDPDCRDGKCGSCVGGPCEHHCHQGGGS